MNYADLDQLLILQEKDTRISKLKKDIASLPELRVRIIRQTEILKQKILSQKKLLLEIEKQIKEIEGVIVHKREYIVKTKTLQSNTRKNEEYQMCIQEVEKTETAITELEEKELLFMEQLDEGKLRLEQLLEHMQQVQREGEENLARLERSEEKDKQLLKELLVERTALTGNVSEESLMMYERMLKSKGVPVIVEMDEKGHCGGCHMVITDNTRVQVLRGHELVYCDSCHRILH